MPAANGQIIGAPPGPVALPTGEGKSSVASPRWVHERTSPAFGGRNIKDCQREDALDLDKAAKRDHDAFEKAVAERDSDKAI
ncbi:hypothetical protein [Ancylobacter sp.]|uniref:hypothetical protein n=1 Tax=Ancylobacter sp. TaxID=1872567 RepID=UPI003C7E515E